MQKRIKYIIHITPYKVYYNIRNKETNNREVRKMRLTISARRWRKRVYHENIFSNLKRRDHKGLVLHRRSN